MAIFRPLLRFSRDETLTAPHGFSTVFLRICQVHLSYMQMRPDEKLRQEIYSQMTPSQKWDEAFRLREIAWIIKAASIRTQHPEWSEKDIQAEVRKIFLYAFT